MRAYRLHTASWSRIVTHRVRRPLAIADRLTSRRRPALPIPTDGQLVLLSCNHTVDPRTKKPVGRRELLDRIVEALSVVEVDGVIASPDLLEELTLLNVLEHRLAFCAPAGDGRSHGGARASSEAIVASHFDGALVRQRWNTDASGPTQSWYVAADIAELAARDLPAILDLSLATTDVSSENSERAATWADWIEPVHAGATTLSTGAGVWMTVPAISGLVHLAEATGFPLLIRDTDVPIHPDAWFNFFQSDLPLTVRGLTPGVSALFPLDGSVAEATTQIARGVRRRGRSDQAA